MRKKIISLVMVASMMAASVTGCGAKEPLKGTEIVAECGEREIPVSIAEFYARYEQAMYEKNYKAYYGDNMWSVEVQQGSTFEDTVKKEILDALKLLYVLDTHKAEYKVDMVDHEAQKAIDEAVKKFMESNDGEALASIYGSEETVKELFRLFTVQANMYKTVVSEVDTEVSDEEAAQKSMDYVFFPYEKKDKDGKISDLTDQEKEELKEKANKLQAAVKKGEKTLAEAAEEAEVKVSTLSFDKDSVAPNSNVVKAADALAEGGVTEVIVDDANGCYVAQVTSLFDRKATDVKKERIVVERQKAHFNEICTKWLEETEFTVHDEIWDQVDFEKKGVTVKSADTEKKENK